MELRNPGKRLVQRPAFTDCDRSEAFEGGNFNAMLSHPRDEIVGSLEVGVKLDLIDDRDLGGCLENGLDVVPLHVGYTNRPRFTRGFHCFKALPGVLEIMRGRNDIWIVQKITVNDGQFRKTGVAWSRSEGESKVTNRST